ncbi:hypothetical protein [Amycolatopsis australiensis]|uniref:hypothetical protein n=1 Tax=Amycolatopsis australiensis TaxID=546364 RepID=UPI00116100D5|nr:hypothetical protein [Amycolatopsis australiensis]
MTAPQHDEGVGVFVAVWGLAGAAGAAAVTWSGRFYLPYPQFAVAVIGAGLLGAATGAGLASRLPRLVSPAWVEALTSVPWTLVVLVAVYVHGDAGDLPANPRADLDTYRGGCLTRTDYSSHTAAHLYLDNTTVTVEPAHAGPPLRFHRTGHYFGPFTAERAQIDGEGITPADSGTRALLASLGCH